MITWNEKFRKGKTNIIYVHVLLKLNAKGFVIEAQTVEQSSRFS